MTTKLTLTVSLIGAASLSAAEKQPNQKPNIIFIMCDDLGYGDLSCFGHPTIHTPHIDKMAAEGMKLTQFYSGASVSTPSRGALLTGRYPTRTGLYGDGALDVFVPNSKFGIPDSEITIAEMLKKAGYATAIIGKWHLGHLKPYLPLQHGFDYYYGIPYSNDMFAMKDVKEVPVIEGNETIGMIADLSELTQEYTKRAVGFIDKNKNNPFFLYFPHTFPHTPLYASQKFKGESKRGLYGDVIMELDWSIGEVMNALKRNHLDKNTLVIFTSDNGPWLIRGNDGGSAGLFYSGKGTSWEGGYRVPCIVWYPGVIAPASVCQSICAAVDMLPTFAKLTGAPLPNVKLDGMDISAIFTNPKAEPRQYFHYYWGSTFYALRKGQWKLHVNVTTKPYPKTERVEEYDVFKLYNIENDPSEKIDVSGRFPNILAEMKAEAEKWVKENPPAVSLVDMGNSQE